MNRLQRHISKKRNERGFTLIELLIVIIILGILAAVVIFASGGIGAKSQLNACKTDAKSLRTAEEAAFAEKGGYKTGAGLVMSNIIVENSTLHTLTASGGTSGDADGGTSNYTAYAIAATGKCEKLSTTATPTCALTPVAEKCYKP